MYGACSIKILIQEENEKTGNIEIQVDDVKYHGKRKEIIGKLFMTSQGIYFLPVKVIQDSIIPYGIFTYSLGLVGLVLDEITKKAQEKSRVRNVDIKQYDTLPLSLLTTYLDNSFGINIDTISYIICVQGFMSIRFTDNKSINIYVEKNKIPEVRSWFDSHNISIQTPSGGGFLSSLFGKLFKKKNE